MERPWDALTGLLEGPHKMHVTSKALCVTLVITSIPDADSLPVLTNVSYEAVVPKPQQTVSLF